MNASARWIALVGACGALLGACASTGSGPASAGASAPRTEASFQVPVRYHQLDNGLKVVLSEDHTAPTVAVAVYYNIGFRIEPRDRTGFAHLFEHMMFQGSENLGKMEFIRLVQSNGGVLNGSTRFDFTNYYEVLPANKLEVALWAEADRMRGLDITQDNLTNQQGVVANEVKVNVLNRPYGGHPWLDMPQHANENWYNAHNFYGDLGDIEAATLEDVKAFFDKYYAPNNAAVAIVGDIDPDEALRLVEEHFGDIPPSTEPISLPDLSEPRQEQEKRVVQVDRLATRPSFAFAYHMPPRNTPEWYAMGLLDQVLLQGEDSLLHQALVQREGIASGVHGGINLLGNMFNYNGPMLWTVSFLHDAGVSEERIRGVIDGVIERVRQQPLDQEVVDRAMVKMRSQLYDHMAMRSGMGRADLLACFALFDDDPERINRIEDELRQVTPALLQETAREYLRPTNRTVMLLQAGAGDGASKEEAR